MSGTDPVAYAADQLGGKNDSLLSLTAAIAQSHSHMLFLYPLIFIGMVVGIFFIVRQSWWRDFNDGHKWAARLVLFLVLMVAMVPAGGASNWLFYQVKGKLSPEFPSMTITAIKVGLYGLELQQTLATHVPAEQKDLFNCVWALGATEANNYLSDCKSSPDCVKAVPKKTKEDIINEINGIQSGKIAADEHLQVCRRVNLNGATSSPAQMPAQTVKQEVPQAPPANFVQIPIHDMMDFNFKTKQEIYDLRTSLVAQYPQFASENYKPSESIFGQIQDGKPWWGMLGRCFYGNTEKSIVGLSEESRFIANPFLLIGLDAVSAIKMQTPPIDLTPYYPVPQSLYWQKDGKKAIVKYDVASFWQGAQRIQYETLIDEGLRLVAYNAKDFGWNYLYVVPEQSKNVTASTQPAQILQFIHTGGSCGYPGGCNNMSPDQSELVIKPNQLPATAYIKVWKNQPLDRSSPADMIFIIEMN